MLVPLTPGAYRQRARRIMYGRSRPWFCTTCGIFIKWLGTCKGEGNVHHIDGNPRNNVDSNLELLCVTCHNKRHSPLKRFHYNRCFSQEYKDLLDKAIELYRQDLEIINQSLPPIT